MADPVQQIKERLNVVDVVGQYVKLTKAGKNYKGLSPFKKEKTPSFYVSPDKGMYYDFSTGQGGDIFTFVQTMEGLDFRGALHMLAERAGVEVTHESKTQRDARERMYDALEEACRFFETKLSEAPQHLEYLRQRGLEDATMRRFRLGFAPDDWRSLHDHMTAKHYTARELEQAGLVKKGDRGSYYDRFRSRIMFPISDAAGRVVAFSGRVVGPAADDPANAKYLNSPETELFEKGRILYGYDKAKQPIRKYDFSIVVEGQMDLVLCHQAGYANTVAASGTGLTDEHVQLLNRLSRNIVFAFDADSAGVASTGRAAALALARDMDVKAVRVPLGKDPADCIREDKEAWKAAVRDARHVVEYFLDIAEREHIEHEEDTRAFILRVRDTVLPYVARIKSGTERAHFIRTVARRLDMEEDAVRQDVDAAARTLRAHEPERMRQSSTPGNEPHKKSRREDLERELAAFLFWQETLEPHVLEEEALATLLRTYEVSAEPLLARHSSDRVELALRAELAHSETANVLEVLEELMRALAREQLKEEQARLSRELRAAERSLEDERAVDALERFRAIAKKLQALE